MAEHEGDALAALLLKQFPPSASALRLLDETGAVGDAMRARRPDLERVDDWPGQPDAVDAVVGLARPLDSDYLARALAALRPGGRLILFQPGVAMSAEPVRTLESAGYTRILVEPALDGLLVRGEKPHTARRTTDRIQVAAARDPAADWAAYRGRYVHLLVQQTPNKPVWALTPADTIIWRAARADGALLAFSSLPRAVAFMQPAVLAGIVRDINKVAKYRREVVSTWGLPIRFNPALDALGAPHIDLLDIDPAQAEAPDE